MRLERRIAGVSPICASGRPSRLNEMIEICSASSSLGIKSAVRDLRCHEMPREAKCVGFVAGMTAVLGKRGLLNHGPSGSAELASSDC